VNDDDAREQEAIHEALQAHLDLDEGEVLTGWIVVYEHQTVGDKASAGHAYGPAGMTTWRALGLCEWAARFTLAPDEDDDE
jgi:hypothetical protein